MSTQHTPGPWILIEREPVGHELGARWQVNGYHHCDGRGWPEDCMLAHVYSIEANARLISAAPDLLAALIKLRDEIKQHNSEMTSLGNCVIFGNDVDEAIAKAIGGSNA